MSELEANTYDPAYWAWLRKQGELVYSPHECLGCGWLHDSTMECGDLCWCGDIHPVSKPHQREPEAHARFLKRQAELQG